jgi:LysR family transcriptional regulator, nitrogen assimilation regulatory protein
MDQNAGQGPASRKPRHLKADVKQLRYFVQIVDSGSVSKAAELLRVAQPSLSLQLRTLEEELGTKLLVRHARGVSPTEEGKVLAEHARKILREIDKIPEVLSSTSSNPTGRVTVGLPTSACRGLSVPLTKAAAAAYPGISLHIVEAMTGNLDEWIESGKLDIALLYNHISRENVAWTEMMVEDLMVIASAGSQYASLDTIRFASLASLPLVLPGLPNTLRHVLERIATRLDMEIGAAIDCDSLQGIIELVKAGCVTIFPSFGMSHMLSSGEFVAIPLRDPTPNWRLSVVMSKRTSNAYSSQAIAQLLAETIRSMVESRQWQAELNFRGL